MVETKKPHIWLSEMYVKKVYKNGEFYILEDIHGNRYQVFEKDYKKYEKIQSD